MSKAHDDGEDSANANFQVIMSYGDYLTLNSILLSQNPKSNAHDEMLFCNSASNVRVMDETYPS